MNNTTIANDFVESLSRSDATKDTYRVALHYFLSLIGNAALDAEAYKKFLIGSSSVAKSTQQTYGSAVRRFLRRQGVSGEILKQLTEDYGQRPETRLIKFDAVAVNSLISYVEKLRGDLADLRDRALILLLVDSGLRIHEACGLKRAQVDWEKYQATIIGKGDREGVVHISDRAMAAIQDYLRARAEMDGGSGQPLSNLPIFARHDRGAGRAVKHLGTKGAWVAFKQRLVEAGVDRTTVRVHDTRHFFVTKTYRESGQDLKLAQLLARHANIATTARYTHLADEETNSRYDQIFNARTR